MITLNIMRRSYMAKRNHLILDGQSLSLANVKEIANGIPITIGSSVKKRINAARALVKVLAADPVTPYYGINTGFGYFANIRITDHQLHKLQHNILKSHAAGYGNPLSIEETRLAMALRLNVLIQGYTGVRLDLCNALCALIAADIYPIIPEYGSVGASGDLIPLAHLALPLIGEGSVSYKGKVVSSASALKKAGLKPIELVEKEGLGLINGTQIMLAVGSLAITKALHLQDLADTIAALSFEGCVGHLDPLNPLVHKVRRQPGQIASAKNILHALAGSYLHGATVPRRRVQDPYSLRCAPQVHGASRDALAYVQAVVEAELNAVTDNPLVFVEENLILSGGNFHGQPIAMAYDVAAIAVAELANISERRQELLLNPHMSGLPGFLATDEGVDSGYMCLQYLSASLVNENKVLSHPASTDSIPGNVGVEDHVSMGMTAARKLRRVVENVTTVLAAEAIAAAEAVDIRKIKKLGKGTKKLYDAIRSVVKPLKGDRIVSEDIKNAAEILRKF